MSLCRHLLAIGVFAWLTALACGGPAEVTPPVDGQLAILNRYVMPPPGRPMSIGGYATTATLRSAGDVQSIWSHELAVDEPALQTLAPGDYELEVTVQPASDAIRVDQNGVAHRDLGPVSARCNATLRITPGERTSIVVTTLGGDVCTVASVP